MRRTPTERQTREEAIVRAVQARVRRARENPADCYEFVMRSEETRARIRVAAHQRLFLEFAEAHDECVIRMPPGYGKTFGVACLILRRLGENNCARGSIVSSSGEQAEKSVGLVKDMIENADNAFPELPMVYPDLAPGDPKRVPWSRSRLTVRRPAGIRDVSLAAYGEGSHGILSSRQEFMFVDDLLNAENTNTEAAIQRINSFFNGTVLTRDPAQGRLWCVVVNTPWAKFRTAKDLTFELEEDRKWPTLTQDCDGNVFVRNTDWDSDQIRPSYRHADPDAHRLTAHDSEEYGAPLCVQERGEWRRAREGEPGAVPFDVDEDIPLWPELRDRAFLENKQRTMSPINFQRNYKMKISVDGDEPVNLQWIENCKLIGRRLGFTRLASGYSGPGRVVIGVDLASARKKKSDKTAIFALLAYPRTVLEYPIVMGDGRVVTEIRAGTRRLLHLESGKWRGPDIVSRVVGVWCAFGGQVVVENNGAQDFMLQWLQKERADVPVYAHTTGRNKSDESFGVESVFYLFKNESWIIPNDEGEPPAPVKEWLDDCTTYSREEHTGDFLMASWFASDFVRRLDLDKREDKAEQVGPFGYAPSVAANIGAR